MNAILIYNIPSNNEEKLIALRIVLANATLCIMIDQNGKGESSHIKRFGQKEATTVNYFKNNTNWRNVREIEL